MKGEKHGYLWYGNRTYPFGRRNSLRAGNDGGEAFCNDYGFVVRAKAETGEDIHFWSFIYEQKSPESIIDGDVVQTLLVYGKYTDEERQFMHPDAGTVNRDQNIEDCYKRGEMKIEEAADEVRWILGGRIHQGAPPKFRISGEQDGTGVKVDINIEQRDLAFYHCGRFENLNNCHGAAGYIVHYNASGTIEMDGKVLKFTDGYGVHERIMQTGVVPDHTEYMSGRDLT